MEKIQYQESIAPSLVSDEPQSVSEDVSDGPAIETDDSKETKESPNPSIPSEAFNRFSNEWSETGALSEESFSELEKMGIPRDYVQRYIDGVSAVLERDLQKIYSSVGGETQYKSLIEWASENLSESEITAYNKAMEGDFNSQSLALKGLKARFDSVSGSNPNLIRGTSGKAQARGFRSTAEMVKAMSDPRYQSDPAYRSEVEQRVYNATF